MSNPFDEIFTQLEELKKILNSRPQQAGLSIEIIDRKELLKRLGITEPTVIRWEKRGKIPAMTIGSSVRYNWPRVIEALEREGKN